MRFSCENKGMCLLQNMSIKSGRKWLYRKEITNCYNEWLLHFWLTLSLFVNKCWLLGVCSSIRNVLDILSLNLQGTEWSQLFVTFMRLVVNQALLRLHSWPHTITSKLHRSLMKKTILIININISTISWQSLFQQYNLVEIYDK